MTTKTNIAFEKKDNDFYLGTRLFAKKFLSGYVINSTLAREVRTFEDMEAFVAFKAALGSEVTYTEDFTAFFNPKARFEEWLKSGDASGLTLTDEQQRARELLAGVKTLFDTHFTVKTGDLYARMAAPDAYSHPDSVAFFANRAITVGRPSSLRDTAIKWLRVANPTGRATGGRVTNGNYEITLRQAELIWKYTRNVWRTNAATMIGHNGSLASKYVILGGHNKTLSVYKDRIEYGCQSIARYAVERLAEEQGWEF